jgi:hypothetical protein
MTIKISQWFCFNFRVETKRKRKIATTHKKEAESEEIDHIQWKQGAQFSTR